MNRHSLNERVVPFTAGDGFRCNLINIRGERTPDKGPVLLVHGSGVRANIFRAPIETNIVDFLVDHGYDVWLENWRASIDFAPNIWSLDQAAVHDHPFAVKKVVEETGASEIKAIIHCQGSTSFMMSAIAGLVPQVKTIVSNAVSLHPVVPWITKVEGNTLVPVLSVMTSYLNPQWGLYIPQGILPNLIKAMVALTHHECDNAVCKLSSFTYGNGHPTLWRHENLNPETHEWIKQEFAHVPMRFFQQMARCLRRGNLVAVDGFSQLPADFAAQPPRTEARFAFMCGEQNVCFLPEGQRRTHDFFSRQREDYHSLHVPPGYGHLDIFIGKQAAQDVFPIILDELERSVPVPPPLKFSIPGGAPGISFREKMAGPFVLGETDPKKGAEKGAVEELRLTMHGIIDVEDVRGFVADPQHRGALSGYVDFPPFGRVWASGGVFQLFSPGDNPKLKWMVYELAFEHDGKSYYLAGKKEVWSRSIFRGWGDTTTLFTRLHEGRDTTGPVIGAGILSLGVGDLLKLLSTLHATRAPSLGQRASAVATFFGLFTRELWKSYVLKR